MHKIATTIIIAIIWTAIGCSSGSDISLTPDQQGSAKEMYEEAMKNIRKDADKARLLFKEVTQLYPDSIYAEKAKIGIADSYFKQKDAGSLILAAAEYQEYVNLYPNSPDAVYAKYQVGMCYYQQMRKPGRDQTNTFTTIQAFESLIKQYPGTDEAEDAKKKIAEARQNLATHYFRIGYYNYKYKAFKGAIQRFKQVINEYPDFNGNDKLFYYTGKSYYKIGDPDSALSFFQKVVDSYPDSKYVRRSLRMIERITREQSQTVDQE